MSKSSPRPESDQLLKVSEEVSRIAGSLARLSEAAAASANGHSPEFDVPEISEESVRWLINMRRERARYLFPGLFADPAWDILLDLLQAEIAKRRVSISSLCIAAGVPTTTALRHITTMTEQKIVVRRPDPYDGRRVFIELTDEVSRALRRYFAEVVQIPQAA